MTLEEEEPWPQRTRNEPVTLAALTGRLRVLSHMEKSVKEELTSQVYQCREAGLTWQSIADILGVTRQAVWQRWGE